MVYYNEDKRRLGEALIKTACIRGHVPVEVVNDMTKWSEWWKSLSKERKGDVPLEARTLENNKIRVSVDLVS